MSLDQILMIPGYSADGGGGGGADFNLSANSLTAGAPVLGTPSLTLIAPSASFFDDPSLHYAPTLASASYVGQYSILRPLNGGTTDVMLCRRTSDGATLPFGGLYDEATITALETWSQGGDVHIVTVYDQSGNGWHATNATPADQPKIVDSGTVIYDSTYNLCPLSDFTITSGSKLTADTSPTIVPCNDLSVTIVGQSADSFGGSESGGGVVFEMRNYTVLGWVWYNSSDRLYSGSGGSPLNDDTVDAEALDTYGWMLSCRTFTMSADALRCYTGTTLVTQQYRTEAARTETGFSFGRGPEDTIQQSGGRACEWFVTSELNDTDRETLFQSINGFHRNRLGPTATHPIPGYQRFEHHKVLWDWLATIATANVTIPYTDWTWDGTAQNAQALADAWTIADDLDASVDFRLGPENFVLDNGDGRGFAPAETFGHIQHLNYGPNTGNGANRLAKIFDFDLTQSNAAQGNPFYQSTPVGIRALASAAINFLGHDYEQSTSPSYTTSADFIGGAGFGSMGAFLKCKSLLSQSVQDAFYQMAVIWLRKIIHVGARHDNANMDAKAIPFCVATWVEANSRGDNTVKALAQQAWRQVMFGSPTGTPSTSVWQLSVNPKAGIYATSGHCVEQGSPETTYNGQTAKELILGYSYVHGVADWDDLKTCIVAYHDWQELQTFDDISPTQNTRMQGPSGYAGRTTDHVWLDQGHSIERYVNAVYLDPTAAWELRYNVTLQDEAAMTTAIQLDLSGIDIANPYPVEMSGTAACHTNGRDYSSVHTFTVDIATDEIVLDNAHNFQVGDPICPYNQFLRAPGVIGDAVGGTVSDPVDFTSTRFWYITAINGQRLQVSDTLGGNAVNFVTTGHSASYSPHFLVPVYYLTDSPDLSTWPVSGTNISHHLNLATTNGRIYEVDNTNKIIAALTDGTAIASGSAVNYSIIAGPRLYAWAGNHWPPLIVNPPPAGWYATQKALIDGNDPSTYIVNESAATHITSLDDEWLSFKQNDSNGRGFAGFISSNVYGGGYAGFDPSTIEAFWAQDIGCIFVSRRFSKDSNDSDWDTVANTWCTQHTWGYGDNRSLACSVDSGGANPTYVTVTGHQLVAGVSIVQFTTDGTLPPELSTLTNYYVKTVIDANTIEVSTTSTGAAITFTGNGTGNHQLARTGAGGWCNVRGNLPNNVVTYNLGDPEPNIVITRRLGRTGNVGAEGSGQEYNDEIPGYIDFTKTFTIKTDGLQYSETLATPNTDYVSEFWHTLPPVNVRDTDQAIADAQIQYWDGVTWQTLTSTLVSAQEVRVVKDHGSGPQYAWARFDQAYSMKTSAIKVQTYQGNLRSQMIHVNLHSTTPGTAALLPTTKTITYTLTSKDPGLVPSAPTVTLTEPSTTTELPDGGWWFSEATIDFYSTNPVATLEYWNGSTWLTAGTMSLITSNIYRFWGGTVPSTATKIRVNATDDSGTAYSAEVNVNVTTWTVFVDDPCNGTAGTVLDSSYTAWTTGPAGGYSTWSGYDNHELDGSGSALAPGATYCAALVNTGTHNVIVETVYDFTVGGSSPWDGIGMRQAAWRSGYSLSQGFNPIGLRWVHTTEVEPTTISANSTDLFRLKVQCCGDYVVAEVENLTTLDTDLIYQKLSGNNPGSTLYGVITSGTSAGFQSLNIWKGP